MYYIQKIMCNAHVFFTDLSTFVFFYCIYFSVNYRSPFCISVVVGFFFNPVNDSVAHFRVAFKFSQRGEY
jgi:hypothetical protein